MKIKTWIERCAEHPDHQTGIVSYSMVQARMQEEIEDLRQHLDRISQDNVRLRNGHDFWRQTAHDAETRALDRLPDAERFRWLSQQTALSLWTDPSEWNRDGQPFQAWGMISVNRRGYPAAETLAQLVDMARADQEDGR